MNWKTTLVSLLLAGFFAIACIKARGPIAQDKRLSFTNFFRLSDRMERLRRSRWQWFSMVALMLVLRLQQQLPLVLELMVIVELAVFMALPVKAGGKAGAPNRCCGTWPTSSANCAGKCDLENCLARRFRRV